MEVPRQQTFARSLRVSRLQKTWIPSATLIIITKNSRVFLFRPRKHQLKCPTWKTLKDLVIWIFKGLKMWAPSTRVSVLWVRHIINSKWITLRRRKIQSLQNKKTSWTMSFIWNSKWSRDWQGSFPTNPPPIRCRTRKSRSLRRLLLLQSKRSIKRRLVLSCTKGTSRP